MLRTLNIVLLSYDHVGVKACLCNDNNPRVEERITKARQAFNACAGLGIRKNGLTMLTCNIIYWTIVIPIATFSSEIWCISETDYEKLNRFQIHVGKRIQRFPPQALNCSFFGLGWMRIATHILIKNILFAMTILRLRGDGTVRQVFIERAKQFKNGQGIEDENLYDSPKLEILKAAARLGILNIFIEMCVGKRILLSKRKWSVLIWERAWMIEDLYWASTSIPNKNNDLLVKAMTKTKYLQ